MPIHLFGYGSLLNKESAERGLQRRLKSDDMRPVIAHGLVRTWREKEAVYFNDLGHTAHGVFLDLRHEPSQDVNGVLIKINEPELKYLKYREKNYKCINLTTRIKGHNGNNDGPVVAFVALRRHWAHASDTDVYVPALYVDKVHSGCEDIGTDFKQHFEKTTEPLQFATLDNGYRFVDDLQARYV